MLEEQKQFTEQKIKDLERITRRFENRISDIQLARELKELMTPFIKSLEKRWIIRLTEKISSEPDLELTLRQLENQANLSSSLFIGGVGLTVSMHNISNHKFLEYNSVFILAEEKDVDSPLTHVFPEGEYACIYYNGGHSDSLEPYTRLLSYIDEKGYKISGDSIERTIINQYISFQEEHYLTEIQIPIKS